MTLQKVILATTLLAISCLSQTTVYAKSCYFNQLSNKYSFQLITTESNQIPNHPITIVEVVISDKTNNHILQAFSFMQENSHLPTYECNARSYVTKYKNDKHAIDGNYGDIVIGDFNFSGKEGIAVASEITNGQTSLYKYYFQNETGKWAEATNFITPNRSFFAYPFPININAKNKSLAFVSHPGPKHTATTNYQLNEKSGKWTQLSLKQPAHRNIKTKSMPHHKHKKKIHRL